MHLLPGSSPKQTIAVSLFYYNISQVAVYEEDCYYSHMTSYHLAIDSGDGQKV